MVQSKGDCKISLLSNAVTVQISLILIVFPVVSKLRSKRQNGKLKTDGNMLCNYESPIVRNTHLSDILVCCQDNFV